jgi:hypothetical protein
MTAIMGTGVFFLAIGDQKERRLSPFFFRR